MTKHRDNLLLMESKPPVNAPLAIEFHGSSFCLRYTNVQSTVENKPPHTAKLPDNRKHNHTWKQRIEHIQFVI